MVTDVVASGNVSRQDMRTLLVPLQCIDRLVSILDPSLRVSATVQRQMNRRECGADALKKSLGQILVGSSNWIKLIVDAVKVEVLGETEEANELLSWLGSMNRASDGRSRIISNLGAAGKALVLILMGGSFGVNATAIAEYAQVISRKRGLRIAESDIIATIGTVNNPPRFWTALAFALASSSITLLWPNNQLASCASALGWGLQEHWMDLGNSHLADSNSLFFQLDRLVWASVYEIAVGKQTAVNALYSMCRSPLFVQACTLEGRESNDLVFPMDNLLRFSPDPEDRSVPYAAATFDPAPVSTFAPIPATQPEPEPQPEATPELAPEPAPGLAFTQGKGKKRKLTQGQDKGEKRVQPARGKTISAAAVVATTAVQVTSKARKKAKPSVEARLPTPSGPSFVPLEGEFDRLREACKRDSTLKLDLNQPRPRAAETLPMNVYSPFDREPIAYEHRGFENSDKNDRPALLSMLNHARTLNGLPLFLGEKAHDPDPNLHPGMDDVSVIYRATAAEFDALGAKAQEAILKFRCVVLNEVPVGPPKTFSLETFAEYKNPHVACEIQDVGERTTESVNCVRTGRLADLLETPVARDGQPVLNALNNTTYFNPGTQ
ncbi:hypothetical protein B0H10DRAFT_2323709 [Mycena sp. CBHHK59/15]|nr:hypothetical protein B0H10DRAFT_2323709 [Mycena sp. CBHHK59/15]